MKKKASGAWVEGKRKRASSPALPDVAYFLFVFKSRFSRFLAVFPLKEPLRRRASDEVSLLLFLYFVVKGRFSKLNK